MIIILMIPTMILLLILIAIIFSKETTWITNPINQYLIVTNIQMYDFNGNKQYVITLKNVPSNDFPSHDGFCFKYKTKNADEYKIGQIIELTPTTKVIV